MSMQRARRCPLHGTCENPGTIAMWGCVTHKHLVRACRDHEQVYRDYGWIRVREISPRPRQKRAEKGRKAMQEVYVLTHEYSDRSRFQICGVTQSELVVQAWTGAGDNTYAYKITVDQIMAAHPSSGGWQRWVPR